MKRLLPEAESNAACVKLCRSDEITQITILTACSLAEAPYFLSSACAGHENNGNPVCHGVITLKTGNPQLTGGLILCSQTHKTQEEKHQWPTSWRAASCLGECLSDYQPRENKKRADISSKNQETHSKNSLFFLDLIYLSTIKVIEQYNYTKNSLIN